jgi:CBS domain-containing protein
MLVLLLLFMYAQVDMGDGGLPGFISKRDFFKLTDINSDPKKTRVAEILCHPVIYILATAALAECKQV